MSARDARRAARDEVLPLAIVVSLLLHAFVYVAVLNACFGNAACPQAFAATAPRDDVVELTQRVAVISREPRRRSRAPGVSVPVPGRVEQTPLAMRGARLPLKRGQGQYWPLQSWVSGGRRYYFVAYRFAYANGTLEEGRVPWPVHFEPADDPFRAAERGAVLATALPPPPSDYLPPGTLGKALRVYFPQLSFSD